MTPMDMLEAMLETPSGPLAAGAPAVANGSSASSDGPAADAQQAQTSARAQRQAKAMLLPDAIKVPGQEWALISVVGPQGFNQRADSMALKLRGVFATEDAARAQAEVLRQVDAMVDIWVVGMYHWLPLPPPLGLDRANYADKQLNDIFQGYAENAIKAKQHFEERKRAVLMDGLDEHLLPEERLQVPDARLAMAAMEPERALEIAKAGVDTMLRAAAKVCTKGQAVVDALLDIAATAVAGSQAVLAAAKETEPTPAEEPGAAAAATPTVTEDSAEAGPSSVAGTS